MTFSVPGSDKDAPGGDPDLTQALAEARRWLEEGQQALEECSSLAPAQAIEQSDKALAAFKKARELAGDDPELGRAARLGVAAAYSQRGHQHRYAHNHAEALADLSQAIRLNPAGAEDYYYRALSYLAKGDQRLARNDFTEYLKRGESDYLRGVAREQLSALVPDKADSQASLSHWRNEGVRLNAEASSAANPRGEGEEKTAPEWAKAVALYNKAIAAFDRALEANSKDVQTRIGLLAALNEQAEAYRQMGEYDLALENYNRARQVWPQPRQLFLRAETLWEAERKDLARAAFTEYLKQADDPSLRVQAEKYLQIKETKAGR